MLLDNIDNSKLFDDVETRTMISMMRNIASNIDLEKASSIAEGVGLPDINSLGKDDGETENVQVFDFDLYIDQFKDENNIEINLSDDGTDIPDTSILYDWLYNNGVTRESVQNDRDSGCKNPYLEGYLEYLDSLVDKQIAEDNAGQVESSAKGDGLGGTEIIGGDEFILDSDGGGTVNGFYYDADSIAAIRKAAEGQAERDAADKARSEEMQKNAEKIQKDLNDPQWRQDTLNEILGNN